MSLQPCGGSQLSVARKVGIVQLESRLTRLPQWECSFDKQLGYCRKQNGSDWWLLTVTITVFLQLLTDVCS